VGVGRPYVHPSRQRARNPVPTTIRDVPHSVPETPGDPLRTKLHALCSQRSYFDVMAVSVTIRNVPEETRDVLAARAARAGQSLQEYVRGQLTALAQRPDPDDLWDRVAERVRATGTRLPADAILEARDADRS